MVEPVLAPVISVSAEASAVVVRLPKSCSVLGLTVDGGEILVAAKLRVIGQDHIVWTLITQRVRSGHAGELTVSNGDGESEPRPINFVDAPWSTETVSAVRQIIRFFHSGKRKSRCEGLVRFLSVSAVWGARVRVVYAAPDTRLAVLEQEIRGLPPQQVTIFAVDDSGLAQIDGLLMATDGGHLLMSLPNGAWRSCFVLWDGQIVQLDLPTIGLRPWAEFDNWLDAQPHRIKCQVADFWMSAQSAVPPGAFEALSLSDTCRLVTPRSKLAVSAVIYAGANVAVYGTAEGPIANDVTLRLVAPAVGGPKEVALTCFSYPVSGVGHDGVVGDMWAFVFVGRGNAVLDLESVGGSVSLALSSGDRVDRTWVTARSSTRDAAWQLIAQWRALDLSDDAYLRAVVLPFWASRWRGGEMMIAPVAPMKSPSRRTPNRPTTIVVVTDGSVEPLHRTLISIVLLVGRGRADVLVVLTNPYEAQALLDCLKVWSTRYDLRLSLAIPNRSLPPFVALQLALTQRDVDGWVAVMVAGALPTSIDFSQVLVSGTDVDGVSRDLLIGPCFSENGSSSQEACWVLSPAGMTQLLKLEWPFGSIIAAVTALKSRFAEIGLSWGMDDRIQVVSQHNVWEHVVPRIDFLMLADIGFTDDLQEPAQGSRRQARSRRTKVGGLESKAPLHLVSTLQERERGERL